MSNEKVNNKANNKPADKDQAPPPTPAGHRFRRYCLAGLLAGTTVLAWISVLSFSATDPPAKTVYPPPTVQNAGGPAGAFLAYSLIYWLGGVGTFVLLLFSTVSAGAMLLGRRIAHLPWRLAGLALMLPAVAATSHIIQPESADGLIEGSGGILGITTARFLLDSMSRTGSWVVLAAVFCVAIMLMADSVVLGLPALGRRLWKRRGDALRSEQAGRLAIRADSLTRKPAPRKKPDDTSPASSPGLAGDESARFKLTAPATRKKTPPPAKTRTVPGIAGKPGEYELPSLDLLADPAGGYLESQEALVEEKRAILQRTLDDFGVSAQVVSHMTGPVISQLELSLAPGVKVSQISSLAQDIARALAVPGVRVVSPLPGRDTIGIEVPNLDKEIVRLKELMAVSPDSANRMRLPLYLGKDAGGDPIVTDLAAMPHLLMAGTTGSGKSVSINAVISSILMTRSPDEVRLILIDPKMVEMAAFEKIPHLLCPIINDMRRVEDILEWVATKMDERYELLKEAAVRNIIGYNSLGKDELYKRFDARSDEDKSHILAHMPYYVVIIDELADLIMTSSKEVEGHIIRIAQKARAVGIHMIVATQRPSVNVVTGLIKSNIPCRLSFRVASRQESRIILDQNGAEVLLGQGDMLFLQPGTGHLARAQGTYMDESEIRALVRHVRNCGQPEYLDELVKLQTVGFDADGQRDDLFDRAVEIILTSQRGSVSLLQRQLQIGYSRASRIVDQMAEAGILGDYKGSQARECMMTLEDWHALKSSIEADLSGKSALDGTPTSV